MPRVAVTYVVRMDNMGRVKLRPSGHNEYRALEFEDGRILLEPQLAPNDGTISRRTLAAMDEAMRRMEAGEAGEAFDLDELDDLLDEA